MIGNDGFEEKVHRILSDPTRLPPEFKTWVGRYASQNAQPVHTVRAPALLSTGLGDAIQGTRYVGATTSGSPTTGYFKTGDFCVDQSGSMWVCTASGDPGTWVQVGGGSFIAPTTTLIAPASLSLSSGTAATLNIGTAGFSGPGLDQVFVTPYPTSGNPFVLTWKNGGTVIVTINAHWPAANYDRYIEAAIANPLFGESSPRLRGSLSPDSDIQTLTFVTTGDSSGPTTLTLNGFQSSGVSRTVTCDVFVQAIPGLVV